RCPACGATNRVPRDKVAAGLHPRCGRCKQQLAVQLGPVTVTDTTFAADVERSPLPVLVDAWAPVVRSMPDDRARDRGAGVGARRARPGGEAQRGREPDDGGTLRPTEHP